MSEPTPPDADDSTPDQQPDGPLHRPTPGDPEPGLPDTPPAPAPPEQQD